MSEPDPKKRQRIETIPERDPVAHFVTNNGVKEALYLEDVIAIMMALEGRTHLIHDHIRTTLLKRIEVLFGLPKNGGRT